MTQTSKKHQWFCGGNEPCACMDSWKEKQKMTQTPKEKAIREFEKEFDVFLFKWCNENYSYLIDTDENDGQELRNRFKELLDLASFETKKEMRVCQEKDFRGITCIQVCKRRNDEVRVETAKEIFKELNIWCLQGVTDFHMKRAVYEKIKARFLK